MKIAASVVGMGKVEEICRVSREDRLGSGICAQVVVEGGIGMEIPEIRRLFENEFGPISEKFDFHCLSLTDVTTASVASRFPGVYVFWKGGDVWKVGRHLATPHKRALEHVRDNTTDKTGRFSMGDLAGDPEVRVLIFSARSESNLHWVAALEIFFEASLGPLIRSRRVC